MKKIIAIIGLVLSLLISMNTFAKESSKGLLGESPCKSLKGIWTGFIQDHGVEKVIIMTVKDVQRDDEIGIKDFYVMVGGTLKVGDGETQPMFDTVRNCINKKGSIVVLDIANREIHLQSGKQTEQPTQIKVQATLSGRSSEVTLKKLFK